VRTVWVDAPHLTVAELARRLQVADGVRVATATDYPGDYEAAAQVTREPWRSGEAVPVEIGHGAAAACTVGVVPTHPEIVRSLRDAWRLKGEPGQRDVGRQRLEVVTAAWMAFLSHETGWRSRGAILSSGFSNEPRPRPHTTIDAGSGQRVGLHLDSWDRLAWRLRANASNRICVNLGAGPRGLQFVPIAAIDLLGRLRAVGLDLDHAEPTRQDRSGRVDLARTFLECFPNVNVVRIDIEPGEAYIAPTENLIHDGFAPQAEGSDLCCTVRGYFEPVR
jgi:hypothetical protein